MSFSKNFLKIRHGFKQNPLIKPIFQSRPTQENNRLRLILLTNLFMFLLFPSINSHARDIRFNSLTTKDGLAQDNILTILQDSKGFMWFGSREVLSRYDGYSFKVFRQDQDDPHSISGNNFLKIVEDNDGILWIAASNILNRFDPETEIFTSSLKMTDHHINTLAIDDSGSIWIGTDKGLSIFEPKSHKVIHLTHDPSNQTSLSPGEIFEIYFDRDDKIWLVGSLGLSQFVPNKGRQINGHQNKGQFIHYNHLKSRQEELKGKPAQLKRITQDTKGDLLIGSRNGRLYQFDPINEQFINIKHLKPYALSPISAIHEDTKGRLWVGTHRKGIYRFNKSRDKTTHITSHISPHSLNENKISAIYEDRQGVIWIATNNGLNYYIQDSESFSYIQHDPDSKNSLVKGRILSFLEDSSGEFWIGTENGLNRYNSVKNEFKRYQPIEGDEQSLPGDYITSIYEDHRNILWFGTLHGLVSFDKNTELFKQYLHNKTDPGSLSSRRVLALQRDKNNHLFVGTSKGLNRYDPITDSFIRNPYQQKNGSDLNSNSQNNKLLKSRISTLYLDAKNRLWVGGRTGLGYYDKVRDRFIQFTHKQNDLKSISNDWIFSMVEDQYGSLWVGTNNGLNRFDDKKNQFERFYPKDGLPSSRISSLLNDNQGNIWIGSSTGLAKMNVNTQQFTDYRSVHLLVGTIGKAAYKNNRN
ncbi:MAG: hypothetical protein HRT89_22390, partial [Lentisphaeria bacterium]|nr:hypothetical protein [Lentisphaeria bacterium]